MLSTNTTESSKLDLTTNLDWALKYAKMGLRAFPLQPGTKIPMTAHGVKDATDDPALIKEWWTKTPDAGIGLAARAEQVGDACFLEFDQRPWLAAWAKELGQEKPVTRLHKSGGKESPHYIFKHTEKSLALGNCDGAKDGHEWFSFRADRRYIVAPPSIHPDSGKPYTVELDVEPVSIPDWVVDAIAAKGIMEREFADDMPELDEDFDFDAFCDWIPAKLGDEDGSWYAFDECPVAGRRHKGQGVRGCALYYDGGKLGFKCMAAECPSNMDRRPGQGGIGYLLSFLSQEHGAYPGVIWPQQTTEDLLEEFGAVEIEDIAGVLPMAIALPAVAKIAIPITEKKSGERVFAKGGLNPADFKPGRVVPCEICGRGCFKSEIVGCGDRCLNHTEASMELAELTREESEHEAVAPTMTEETLPQEPETKEFALVEGTNSKEDVLRIYGILASDIEPEPLEWLWQDKIPAGKITLFAGQPDCGKTIAMLDIVARVTKGEKFPDGSENTLGPRRVLLAATEDDLESTLVPRLMAAGADMTKVVILKRVEIERAKGSKHKTERRILQLKADAKLLRYMLKKNPDIALVALDPISSYFGDADPNKDKEIRPVMEAVAEACDQSGVSFVAIIHNNKRGDADAIGKILGASSVVGVSRAVWGFAHDPEDTDKKYMTLVKGNLARNRKGMKYRIADATVVIKGKDRVLPRIEWIEETDASANDVLDMQRDSSGRKDAKKIDMIKLLLQKQLDETPGNAILLRDFYSLCEKERLGDGDKIKKTVQRAVKDIGATTAKPPNSKGPWWIMMDIDAHPWVGQFEADGKDSKGHEQPKGWLAEAI